MLVDTRLNKLILRKKLLNNRNSIITQACSENTKIIYAQIIEIIKSIHIFDEYIIGLYSSLKGEVNLLEIFNKVLFVPQENTIFPYFIDRKNINLALPVINNEGNNMYFTRYGPNQPLYKSRFSGLLQPYGAPIIPNIIVVPAVALSCSGYRMGFGLGYYDSYLKRIAVNYSKVITIGVSFHNHLMNFLPFNKNDFKLDYIVTDKILIKL